MVPEPLLVHDNDVIAKGEPEEMNPYLSREAKAHSYDFDSDTNSDCYGATMEEPRRIPTDEMIRTVTENKPDMLAALMEKEPNVLNAQASKGNTLLVTAARLNEAGTMDMLLCQASIGASICNFSQESALHFMSQYGRAHSYTDSTTYR